MRACPYCDQHLPAEEPESHIMQCMQLYLQQQQLYQEQEEPTIQVGMCRHCHQQYQAPQLPLHERMCTARVRKCIFCLENMESQDHYEVCRGQINQFEEYLHSAVSYVGNLFSKIINKCKSTTNSYLELGRQQMNDLQVDLRSDELYIRTQMAKIARKLRPQNSLQPEKDQICSICLRKYQAGEKASFFMCKHIYHSQCIRNWQDFSKISCPMCRQELNKICSTVVESKNNNSQT